MLSCLQQCMAEARLPPQAVDALRRVRMLPVEGGAFVAAAEVQVYFPIKATTPGGRSSENVAAAAEAAGLRLSGVVELLRPELMDEMARVGLGGSDRASSQAILRQLGVQALTLHELVDRHLLSCLLGSGEQEGEEDKDRLLAMLGVVRHHSACLPSEADRAVLRSRLAGLKVLTANNGVERLRSRGAGDGGDVTPHVYLSSDFGCELLPPSLIEALGWVALDPGYLSRGGKRGEWRSFFHSLGARELPAPTAFRRMVTWEEKATDSIMAAEDWGHGPYTIKDWRFPEIEDLLGGSLSVRDRQALANCLDSSWDSHFSNFCTVSLLRRPDPFHDISLGEAMAEAEEDLALSHELSTSVPSTFLLRLKGSAWLPARDGSLYGPEQLFNVHRQDMAQIFRKIQDHLPVLDHTVIELRSHRFKQAIGLERHLSPSMLLDALRRCAADPVFKQSTEVLLPVYQQLATIMQMDNSVVTQASRPCVSQQPQTPLRSERT